MFKLFWKETMKNKCNQLFWKAKRVFQWASQGSQPQMPSDASQMPPRCPRCLPDASEMHPRCPVPPISLMCRRCLPWDPGPFESFVLFYVQKKVSELSVKCLFGLHRRERIACATFQKRLQNVILKKWFFWLFFGSFPTWAQEGQTGQRRVPKGVPKRSPLGVRGSKMGAPKR